MFLFPTLSEAGDYKNNIFPECNLNVNIDVKNSQISGISGIKVKAGHRLSLFIGTLEISSLKFNGQPLDFQHSDKNLEITPERDGILEVRFTGVFKGALKGDNDHESVYDVIDDRGVSLTGIWYPYVAGLCYYRLIVTLPVGYEAISEAEEIIRRDGDKKLKFYFKFPYPVEGIHLVATDRYKVIKDKFHDIEIYAYFFKEDIGLAKEYIEFTKKYLNLYEELIGKFPYKKFSIAENFLPTGYSMPTLTMLGNAIVRLPFIVKTSLGHEILHQWFGSYVYVDQERGNWSEGLTTYLSDHLYEELEGRGWEYRKQVLIDYESYVNERKEFPVRRFRERVDFSTRAVGYGKAALVFHMLKNLVGEGTFYRSLRTFIEEKKFQKASWEDLQHSFERFYGGDMGGFFCQWLDKKGLIDFEIQDLKVTEKEGKYEISFSIIQKGNLYTFYLPIKIYLPSKDIEMVLKIEKERDRYYISFPERPEKIVFDENYDIARRITNKEFPPVVARLIGEEDILVSVPSDNYEIYSDIIDKFKGLGATIKGEEEINITGIQNSSLVILGNSNALVARLYGRLPLDDAGFSVTVKENPWNPQKVIAIFHGKSKIEIEAALRKVTHYGRYSKLLFNNGRNVGKEREERERGIAMVINRESRAIALSDVKTVTEVLKRVRDKRVIYIGESHDLYAHHLTQLEIIKELYKNNQKIAIGMEMFQRPFQKVIDEYITGNIDEREFLKGSEYFKRWGYDYRLYKPIIDFARSEKVPIIALNIEREIIEKVSQNGLDSLSEDERERVPLEMDFSDSGYRERVKEIFGLHKTSKDKNFEFFYQSQILWDETMSQSLNEFLMKNPDHQVVVIAGQGHIEYGSGIPKRTFRRNGYDYSIVLNDAMIREGIADYIIFPEPLEIDKSPKIMAFLKEEEGKIKIERFPEESISKKAGLKEGDIILSFDDSPIRGIDDIKIYLFYKKEGDVLRVKVLRRGEKNGEAIKEIELRL